MVGQRLDDPAVTGSAPVLRVVNELTRTHTTDAASYITGALPVDGGLTTVR